ncbi:MAG: hypothetical protein QW598_04795 [Pyrobaculum sp.]
MFSLISASPLDAVAPALTLFKNLLALGLFFRLLEPGKVAWALGKVGVRGPAVHLIILSMRASDVLSRGIRSFIVAQRAKGVSGAVALLRAATPLVVYSLEYAEYLSVQLRQRSFKCIAVIPPFYSPGVPGGTGPVRALLIARTGGATPGGSPAPSAGSAPVGLPPPSARAWGPPRLPQTGWGVAVPS